MAWGLGDRGEFEVIGEVVLVGIAVIFSIVVAVVVFQIGPGSQVGPIADFEFRYDETTGGLTVKPVTGDPIATDSLVLRGGTHNRTDWPIETLTAGQSVQYYARPGDTVQVVWTERNGTGGTVVDEFEVPAGPELQPLSWRASGGNSVGRLQSAFVADPAIGLQWEPVDEKGGGDYVRATVADRESSWLRYERVLSHNDGAATVTMEFRQVSFEDSGYRIGLIDDDGRFHTLWCSPSGNPNPGSWGVDPAIECPDGVEGLDGRKTVRESIDGEFGRFVIILDLEGSPGTVGDDARFYEIDVDTE